MTARLETAPRLSVVMCVHNPEMRHFDQALHALHEQTLSTAYWELLVVDNASDPPIAATGAMSRHPHHRIVKEPRLGLTYARLRGIAEARAEVLVFVDADNILDPDYLDHVLDIAAGQPKLGLWSGRVELEFEASPPLWTRPYWQFLVERLVDVDATASGTKLVEPMPVGAGLCVRGNAARTYAEQVMASQLRQALDRRGASLFSGGDTDLVLTACAAGWERGVFKALRLRHLIPPERTTEPYLVELMAGIHYSSLILEMLYEPQHPPAPTNWWWWLKYATDCATKFGRKRRFYRAYKRAHIAARTMYERALRDGWLPPAGES